MNLETENAEVGKKYRVSWHDCCVEGSFTAVLAKKNYVPDPPDTEDYLESITFDNGVTISGNSLELELIDEENCQENGNG